MKRGRGGIRDVEFAVQLLQMVHGRRDPRLREPNTLRALATLAEEGYVPQADADALADAYRFLRRLEHRLQIVRDLQTHDLPARPARADDARALAGPGRRRARCRTSTSGTTELVRGIHERLFYRPLLEAFAGPAAPRPGVDRAGHRGAARRASGSRRPRRSYEVLRAARRPGDPDRARCWRTCSR